MKFLRKWGEVEEGSRRERKKGYVALGASFSSEKEENEKKKSVAGARHQPRPVGAS